MSDEPKLTGKAKALWNRLSAREKLAFLQRFRELDAGTLSQDDACRELEAIVAQFARELGADSVGYQSIPGLVRAIGLPKNELCLACLTEKYPTPWGQKLYELARKTTEKGRTYELVVKA